MKYKVGDKVRIKSIDWYYENKDRVDEVVCGNTIFIPDMIKYCDKIVTISSGLPTLKIYRIEEDGGIFNWIDEMIEGLVEEEVDLIPKFGEYSDNEPLDVPTMTTDFVKEYGLPCPNGYIFKDENGNIINATKIVLEKKKKEYPKTYGECCRIMDIDTSFLLTSYDIDFWKGHLLTSLQKLLICRNAYWKIAGAEMGLGKPWEPNDSSGYCTYAILRHTGHIRKSRPYADSELLEFPTEEMRDAFYENFKELIEQCKELL